MNDNGKVNRRILAALKQPDPLQRLESAYRTYPTTFYSPDVKRLYLRLFESTALQVHYVEVFARMEPALGAEVAEKCENHLAEQLQTLSDNVDRAIEAGEALKQANGLTQQVSFLPDGLAVDVRVTSPILRKYLILMEKSEQMIALLETLRIDGVITTAMCDTRRAQLKAQIKTFARAARQLANSLRSRDNAAHKSPGAAKPAVKVDGKAEATVPATGTSDNGAAHARHAAHTGNGSANAADSAIKAVEDELGKRWPPVAKPRQKRGRLNNKRTGEFGNRLPTGEL